MSPREDAATLRVIAEAVDREWRITTNAYDIERFVPSQELIERLRELRQTLYRLPAASWPSPDDAGAVAELRDALAAVDNACGDAECMTHIDEALTHEDGYARLAAAILSRLRHLSENR